MASARDAKSEVKHAAAAAAAGADGDMDADEAPVTVNEDFRNIVIIDNLPSVTMDKFAKLSEYVRKLYSAYGTIVPDGFYMPVDGNPQVTSGYAFIEYATAEEAARALAEGDNKKLDATHVLRVTLYSDFDKYVNMSEEYLAPAKQELEAKFNPNGWLLDKEGRDQLLLRFARHEHKRKFHETEVFWSDPVQQPPPQGEAREMVYDGRRETERGKAWCELYTAWSPRGTYLATFHHQGIVLWAGDDFQKIGRFPHADVKVVDFSPCEKYLVTSTFEEKRMRDEKFVIVWDIAKQQELRSFDAGGVMLWPMFRWSFDDKYLSRTATDVVQVYETPGMGLLEKKSVKLPGVQEVQASPTDNYLSYWIPERDNTPAVVALMALPSRKVVREKHMHFVTDVRMHWQAGGDFLCCKVSRKRAKKPMPSVFVIFRLRNKEIPIEEFELNDSVHAFAWEPKGTRFAVAHGEQSGGRCFVSFYNITKKKVELIRTLEGKQCNSIFWSPAGLYVILAHLGQNAGSLEWVEAATATTVASHDHFQCSDVDWSPCGRYVITSSTQPLDPGPNFKATVDNAYKLWNMQGRQLFNKPVEALFQAAWRPRPPSTLTPDKKDEKYLRDKYWDGFSKIDEKRRATLMSGVQDERRQLKEAWKALRAEHLKDYNEEAALRVELRKGLLSDEEEDFVTIETVVEEETSRTEEVVTNKEYITHTQQSKAKAAAAGGSGSRGGLSSAGLSDD